MENISLSANDRLLIGLISDTHLFAGSALDVQIAEAFRKVDLILHAGDIYDLSVLNELERIAPVLAVKGDDEFETLDGRVKEAHFLNIDGLTLWLQHRMPWGMIQLLYSEREAELADLVRQHCPDVPDIVVFGDTHMAFEKRLAGILFVNPGSPTAPGYATKPGTLAFLSIVSGKAKAHVVQLAELKG